MTARIHSLLPMLALMYMPWCHAEADLLSSFTGIRARSSCLAEVKGLGAASIAFSDSISKKNYHETEDMNSEFFWDAFLITTEGKSVPIILHCTRSKFRAMPEKGISEPWIAYMAEIVKR